MTHWVAIFQHQLQRKTGASVDLRRLLFRAVVECGIARVFIGKVFGEAFVHTSLHVPYLAFEMLFRAVVGSHTFPWRFILCHAVVIEFPTNGLFGFVIRQGFVEGEEAIEQASEGMNALVDEAVAEHEIVGEGHGVVHQFFAQLRVLRKGISGLRNGLNPSLHRRWRGLGRSHLRLREQVNFAQMRRCRVRSRRPIWRASVRLCVWDNR